MKDEKQANTTGNINLGPTFYRTMGSKLLSFALVLPLLLSCKALLPGIEIPGIGADKNKTQVIKTRKKARLSLSQGSSEVIIIIRADSITIDMSAPQKAAIKVKTRSTKKTPGPK